MTAAGEPRVVAMLGINYPPERTGIAPYTGAMARALASRGCRVRVVTAHPHYPEWEIYQGYGAWRSDEDDHGVAVRRLLHYVPRRPRGYQRLLSEITLGVRMLADRSWGRADAVVLVSPALFASAIASVRARLFHRDRPLVVWVQDLYGRGVQETGETGGVGAGVVRRVERGLLRRASTVVVIHDRFKALVCEDYGVEPDRVAVVRNWTHVAARAGVDRDRARRALGWGTEAVVVHAGNMGRKQGLDHVVAAARLAHERGDALRFVMVGDGSERERLERLSAGLTTIEFLGSLDARAFGDALAAADVLLVHEAPGISEMAVPSKLTSYFDAGRPVLAATAPDGITADEVRAARAGVVVTSGDADALIAGALGLARDAARALEYGANGRAYRDAVLSEAAAVDAFAPLVGVAAVPA